MTDAAEPTAAHPGGAVPAAPVARTSAATDVALVATFAAFLAVCALVAIPVPGSPVPITLQTFAVMLAGIVLGARRGTLAVLLYLVVGLAGLPIFSGGAGGVAVLAKPSLGYIAAFPLAAGLAGWLVTRSVARRPALRPTARPVAIFLSATAASLLLIHPIGITVMAARLDLSPGAAIAAGATYLPGDLAKNLLAAVVAAALFRAFPDLLRSRR